MVDEIDHFLFVVAVSSSLSSILLHCSDLVEDHTALLRAGRRARDATRNWLRSMRRCLKLVEDYVALLVGLCIKSNFLLFRCKP